MENEILDFEIKEIEGTSFRKKLIIIECILVIIILISLSLQFFTHSIMARLIFIITTISFILFYLINPLFRFFKKENSGKISLLYFIQNLLLLPFIFGIILKIESWPYASELMFGGLLSFTLLFILPHIELEKTNATRQMHFYTLSINIAFLISFLGLLFKLESWEWSFEFSIIGSCLSLMVFFTMVLSFLSNREKLAPIGFYLPRLLLGLYFAFPAFTYFF